jgi:GTP-binding protein Era
MKTGIVTIVGRPNVGKSTLLNAILKEKIAIVSDKPQTTRTRILGVAHLPGAQIVFLDTPGLHQPQHQLNKRMVRTAIDAIHEADLLYVMVDATAWQPTAGDRAAFKQIASELGSNRPPCFLLINKVDLVRKPKLLPLIETYQGLFLWSEIVPISAKNGINIDRLLELTVRALGEGEAMYDEDTITDQPMRALAAEIIREKILMKTREEIPHSVAVEIDRFLEEGKLARIAATILVEKETQKPIVIGRHGERLKEIGTEARVEMERLFGMKVFLELWVKVREAWREDEQVLSALGY